MKRSVCAFLAALLLVVVTLASRPSLGAAPAIAVYPPLTLEASTTVDLRARMVQRLQTATGTRVQALPFPSGIAADSLTQDLAVNAKSNDFDRFLVITTHPSGADVAVDLALYDTATKKRVGTLSTTAQAIGASTELDLSVLMPKDAAPAPVVATSPPPVVVASPPPVVAPAAPAQTIATATVAAPAAAPVIVDPGAAAPAERPGGLRGLIAKLRPAPGDHAKRMNVILLPFAGSDADPLSVHATLTFVQELGAIDVGVKVVKGVDASASVDDAICQISQSNEIVTLTHASGTSGATTFGVALHACEVAKDRPAPDAQALRQHFEENVAHNPSTDPVVNAVRRLIRGMLADQG